MYFVLFLFIVWKSQKWYWYGHKMYFVFHLLVLSLFLWICEMGKYCKITGGARLGARRCTHEHVLFTSAIRFMTIKQKAIVARYLFHVVSSSISHSNSVGCICVSLFRLWKCRMSIRKIFSVDFIKIIFSWLLSTKGEEEGGSKHLGSTHKKKEWML